MSVVVAIKENGKIYMGCDSQVTCGTTKSTLSNPNNFKMWKVKGVDNCLMASVGDVRNACVIRTIEDLVTEYDAYKGRICYEFVVNRILPTIIERLQDANYLKRDEVFRDLGSSILFAYKDQLYEICYDGSVFEIDGCVALGSGMKQALGSMIEREGEDPKTRIVKAIKSSMSDIYVDYPIILSDTETTEFDIIAKESETDYLKSIEGQTR